MREASTRTATREFVRRATSTMTVAPTMTASASAASAAGRAFRAKTARRSEVQSSAIANVQRVCSPASD